jgi:hypothetical protein
MTLWWIVILYHDVTISGWFCHYGFLFIWKMCDFCVGFFIRFIWRSLMDTLLICMQSLHFRKKKKNKKIAHFFDTIPISYHYAVLCVWLTHIYLNVIVCVLVILLYIMADTQSICLFDYLTAIQFYVISLPYYVRRQLAILLLFFPSMSVGTCLTMTLPSLSHSDNI